MKPKKRKNGGNATYAKTGMVLAFTSAFWAQLDYFNRLKQN